MRRYLSFLPHWHSHWLPISIVILIVSISIGTVLLSITNRGYVNHIIVPIASFVPIIKLLWQDNVLGTIQFVASKSLFALSYFDSRSQLNIWTYEFDSLTLSMHIFVSVYLARFLTLHPNKSKRSLWLNFGGSILLILSVSYCTVITHCAGPTWIGFVVMYGLGYKNFEHMPIWQILLAGGGISQLLLAHYYTRVHSIAQRKNTI